MKKIKELLDHIFIDGLSGMAQGLFATLIIGTIIQQIGTLIGGPRGDMIFAIGKVAAALTGAGIGVGVAAKFKESYLVVVSAATAGMVGAFASKLLAGTVLVDGTMVFAGPGESGSGQDKSGYFGNTDCDHWNRLIDWSPGGTGRVKDHDKPWCNDQLGRRAAAIFDGNRGIGSDGDDPDSSDQFGSAWHYSEPVRSGGRCSYRWMLL